MCEPATIAAGVAAIAGSYMSSEAQNKAADKQQRAINASLEQQDQYSQKAEQKALENADQYQAGDRLEKFDEARVAAGDSLAKSLTASRESAPIATQASGRMSQEFLTGDASAKADQFAKSINNAQLMGRMRGAGDMLTNEGYTNADYASQLGLIGRNAQGSAAAAQPGIIGAGKVNSGQVALGSGLSTIGSLYLGSNLGKGMNDLIGKINPELMSPGTSPVGPTQGMFKTITSW